MTIQFAKLAANNTVTGTTITDDPTLQLSLDASTRYRIVELSEWYVNNTVDWKRKLYLSSGSVSVGPNGMAVIRQGVASLATSTAQAPQITPNFLGDEYSQNGSDTTSHRAFSCVDAITLTDAAASLRIARSALFSGTGTLTTYAGSALVAIPAPYTADPDVDLAAYVSSDQTIAVDAADTSVTGMTVTLAADRDYLVDALLAVKAAGANAAFAGYGLHWGFSGTLATALLVARISDMVAFTEDFSTSDSTAWMWSHASSTMASDRSPATGAANTYSCARVLGVVRASASGDFAPVINPTGTAGDSIVVQAGSCLTAIALN